MTIFQLPDDTVFIIKMEGYYCPMCKTIRKNCKLKIKTTSSYHKFETIKRWCLVIKNPYCSCSRGIWTEDGPCKINEK